MKSIVSVFLIAPFLSQLCLAQPIKITGLDRAGTLVWTNLSCTTQPAYEVLQASSVEGPWTHLAFVTNRTSVSLSDELTAATSPVFLRIAWVDEPPLVFDYAFYGSEFGLTTVTGRLEVALPGMANGRRSFAPTEYYEFGHELHPIGDAPLAISRWAFPGVGTSLQVYLVGFGGEGSIYLEGTLNRSEAEGRCTYTHYSGSVWFVGFHTQEIGTFSATRVP